MVVDDLDIFRPRLAPSEADPVLIVDPDTVLPGTVTLELLEAIARRNPEVVEFLGRIQRLELTNGDAPERLRKRLTNCAGRATMEQVFRRRTAKRSDHRRTIAWTSCYDNSE